MLLSWARSRGAVSRGGALCIHVTRPGCSKVARCQISAFATPDAKHAVLVDGSHLAWRSWCGMPSARLSVFGFMSSLVQLQEELRGHYFGIGFDGPHAELWRRKSLTEYKKNRVAKSCDQREAFQRMRSFCDDVGLIQIECASFEADDIVATYTDMATANDCNVSIISRDKDLAQLIEDGPPRVTMLGPEKKSPRIGEVAVKQKWGVRPDQMVDFLALVGDSSDNLPGVPGIGPKIAGELLAKCGNLTTVRQKAREGYLVKKTSKYYVPSIGKKRLQAILDHGQTARKMTKLIELSRIDKGLLPEFDKLEFKGLDLERFEREGWKGLAKRVQSLNEKLHGDMAMGS